MQTLSWFGAGGKVVAVAVFVLAAVAGLCQGQIAITVPSSRGTGYRASVDLKLPKTGPASAGRGKVVLETEKFQLWLEGDAQNKCSLSVREKYESRGNQPLDRGRLLWSANYFSRTPTGAEKCTLTFTAHGDLQLWIVYKHKTSLTWSSKTAHKGVTKMALDTHPDIGNFKLLKPSGKSLFNSFDVKQWLILSGQKFRTWEVLKSPDQVYPEADTIVLANGGRYIMAIKGGDLQLLTNGPKPQVYWSLKKTTGFKGDLSKVAYAARVQDKAQGIGLYTSAGKLVHRQAVPEWAPQLGRDWNFGIDYYGNLKYYFMYRGVFWYILGWQAFENNCDLPNFCGHYGVCSATKDPIENYPKNDCTGCPAGFRNDTSISPSACKRTRHINKCNHTKYLELAGYESAHLSYVTPTKVSLKACKARCSADCHCDGVFYNFKAGNCFQQTQFLTLKNSTTAKTGMVAYIKV